MIPPLVLPVERPCAQCGAPTLSRWYLCALCDPFGLSRTCDPPTSEKENER